MANEMIGAGVTAAGLLGGLLQKGPEDINVDYPEATPFEKEMAKAQFDSYVKLKDKIQDPKILADLLSLLPAKNMSPSDLARYETEFKNINAKISSTAMEQEGRAVGRQIQDLVDRGVISKEQGAQQLKANKERITQMANINFQNLEAKRLELARGKTLQTAGENLTTANLIARNAANNQSTMLGISKNFLNAGQSEAGNRLNLASNIATSNFNTGMGTFNSKQNLLKDTSSTLISDYVKEQQRLRQEEENRTALANILSELRNR